MEDLIIHAHILFPEHPSHYSPPLPPTPAGEPVPVYPYGSKSTKVANVLPSTPSNNAASHAMLSPQDFTPRLPARPTSSIHPSLRANPQSPTKAYHDNPPPLPSRAARSSQEGTPPSSPTALTTYETDVSPSPDEPGSPLRPAPAVSEAPPNE